MIIPEGWGQVNFRFGGAALPDGAEVTLGVDHSSNTDGIGLQAEAIYDNFVGSGIMSSISQSVELTGVLWKQGPNSTGGFFEYSETTPGTANAATAPPNVTYLIRKVTSFGGRAGRGRMYLPGVPETNPDPAGVLTEGLAATITGQMDSFLTAMAADSLFPALLHNSLIPFPVPLAIDLFVCDPKVATQRRRLRK